MFWDRSHNNNYWTVLRGNAGNLRMALWGRSLGVDIRFTVPQKRKKIHLKFIMMKTNYQAHNLQYMPLLTLVCALEYVWEGLNPIQLCPNQYPRGLGLLSYLLGMGKHYSSSQTIVVRDLVKACINVIVLSQHHDTCNPACYCQMHSAIVWNFITCQTRVISCGL